MKRIAAACFVVSLLLATSHARAEPSAAEKETARKLVKSGRSKLTAGDHAAALADFKAAHDIMNVPTTGLELGKAQIAVGKLVEARDTLLAVVRASKEPGEPPQFAQARKKAGELAKQTESRIAALEIEIVGAMDGPSPRVLVDDTQISEAMLRGPIAVNPGAHTVVVEVGEGRRQSDVTVGEGESSKITLDISGLAPPEKDKPAPPPPKREPELRTNPLVFIGFGFAGAAAVAGGITGYLAFSHAGDAEEHCDGNRCGPEAYDSIDAGRTLATASTIAFAIAAVGAGVGVYGLLNPLSAEPAGPSVGLWIGPAHAGVAGRF